MPVASPPFQRLCAVAVVLATILGCADSDVGVDSKVPVLLHESFRVERLESDWGVRDPILGLPYGIVISGPVLWVVDMSASPFLHVVDTISAKVIRSIGRQGEGPGDFEGIGNILPHTAVDSAVRAFDPAGNKITSLTPSSFSDSRQSNLQVSRFGPDAVRRVYPLGPRKYLGFTSYSEEGFRILDSAGTQVATANFPHPGSDSIPMAIRFSAALGAWPCARTDGTGFAVTFRNAGRITLFDSEGRPLSDVSVPYPSDEHFNVNGRTKKLEFVPARIHYIGCVFTRDHLFALYSGKRVESIPKRSGEDEDGAYLHRFSLEGRLQSVFLLDHGLSAFALDSTGRRLFGVSWSQPGIYGYIIPALPR